ncbi:class I SAM-dependent methyltransferase [Jiella sonneratiae]|uniref:Class I SAM-dependent methyltransferase n=1 Tax=Jiella sonneratiae TaxID=2816856 RepID=A0ABS3J9Y1_9HYPH|nr:class I SAM-dependent methyltransferase [Jiella sonneratiae]MBO0906474.1 class I SAM-dependent methyltransferase [Jiella sonneratiae]
MRRVIGPAGFEALFRADPDPWGYARSRFERQKRGVLLSGCGAHVRGRVLELACANGETSAALSRLALRLIAADASPAALRLAEERNRGRPRIRFVAGILPRDMPRGPFDLIVASEILYYLAPRDLDACLRRIETALAPGGRLVLLHHLVAFDDAATRPAEATRRAERHFGRCWRRVATRRTGRYKMTAFARPRLRRG